MKLHKLSPGGVAQEFGPLGMIEYATSTCSHCQKVTVIKDRTKKLNEYVDICRGCMRLICLRCANKPCLPWEKQCEYQERQELKLRIESKLGF